MAIQDFLEKVRVNTKRGQQFVAGANLPKPKFVGKIKKKLAISPVAKLIKGEGLKSALGIEQSALLGRGPKPTRQEVMDIAMSFGPGAIGSIKKAIQPAMNVAKQSAKEGLEILAAKKAIPSSETETLKQQAQKALGDISEAIRLQKNAPLKADPLSGVKTKADYEKYIDEVKKYVHKKMDEMKDLEAVKVPSPPVKTVIPTEINTRTFRVSEEGRKAINAEIDELKEIITQKTGQRLSNQEVKDYAKNTSQILKRGVDREATKKWESAVYNLRTTLAEQAESGKVTQEFIDNIVALKSAGTDVARKLQSLGIEAAPGKGNQQALIEAILDSGAKADEVIKAAEGVNFNNYNESVNFYRQFVKPKMGEWIDLVRYNSMLSSPLTHIVNTSSNLLGSALIKPLTKEAAGVFDFIVSKISGKAQKNFSGEGIRYMQGFVKGINKAFNESLDVMRGKKTFEALDIQRIAPATKGIKGVIARGLSFPLRGLEAADRFFSVLNEAGEIGALRLKQRRGVRISEEAVKLRAIKEAVYTVFRQKPGEAGQGVVLGALDSLTSLIMQARSSSNPIVSGVAKWTLPFVQTPANLVKQGLEYSPLGVLTTIGAKDVTTQLAKATIGSTVFGMTYIGFQSDRITGPLPTSAKEKEEWAAAGRLPWAIKVGNKWVQYNRLHPAIGFPMALVSTIEQTRKEKEINEDVVKLILRGVSNYANFYSDQAYFKSIGDLFNALKGDSFSLTKLAGNYPQQLIPYRALGGWLARLTDEYERKPDYGASFINKQMQLLFMNIPGLSQKVPMKEALGEPLKAEKRLLSAFSPVRIKEVNEQLDKFLKDKESFKKAKKEAQAKTDEIKERVRPIYQQIQTLLAQEREDEASDLLDELTEEEYDVYKSIKTSDKRAATERLKVEVYPIFVQIQDLLSQGREGEAGDLLDDLTDEQYKAYSLITNALLD